MLILEQQSMHLYSDLRWGLKVVFSTLYIITFVLLLVLSGLIGPLFPKRYKLNCVIVNE